MEQCIEAIVLKTLLEYNNIFGNEYELLNKLTSVYDNICKNTKKKARVTNPVIVDCNEIM